MPVRRFRSRLRPFLRVTRHSQARGAPSWRAIPRTSAELMASTTAGTLRCATCGCRRSSCARVMFATLTVPASLHATAAAQCVSSFLRVSVTVSSSRRLPALHFCGPQPGAWRPFRAQGPWLCLLPLVPVARCWLALHSPTSRRFAISAPSPSPSCACGLHRARVLRQCPVILSAFPVPPTLGGG